MAESNQQPPLCPCGFFGSPTTAGLCSKCYRAKSQKEELENAKDQPNSPATAVITDASISDYPVSITNGCVAQVSVAESNVIPVVVNDEQCDTAGATGTDSLIVSETSQRPIQKNKKRCFKCNQRLELAFTEIGRCKCDYIFCEHHRLPEQHDCLYDHKEKGRQEALTKMVSPKKHIGTSLRRLDSDN